MENVSEEGFFEKVKAYVHLQTRLYALVATEKVARFYAKLIGHLVVFICLIMAFFFGSFALAYFLGNYWNNVALGFLGVMGMYLLLALVGYLAKQTLIERPITNKTIEHLLGDEEGGANGN